MRRARAWPALAAAALAAGVALAQERAIPPGELRSGSAFLGADLRALQNDDFANPGMLWVERGEKLWSEPAGKNPLACASCHKDTSMRGVAASHPKIDKASGKIVNRQRLVTGGVPPYPETQQYVKSAIAFLTNTRFSNAMFDLSPRDSRSVLRFSDGNRSLNSANDSRRPASVLNQKSGSSFIEVEW